MDLQAELKKQEGQTLETLSHGKPFTVGAVTARGVLVHPAGSKERKVTWRQLDPAWAHLRRRGQLNQIEVREKYSKVSSGHVLALLAVLPGVTQGKEKAEDGGRLTPTLYYPVKKSKKKQPAGKLARKTKQRDDNDWAVWLD